MKSNYWLLTVIFALVALPGQSRRMDQNQPTRLFAAIRQSSCIHERNKNVENYSLIDAFTGKMVRTFNTTKATGKMGGMKSTYRLNFSNFTNRARII